MYKGHYVEIAVFTEKYSPDELRKAFESSKKLLASKPEVLEDPI